MSYREPLEIVRGEDVWLVDARGRAFLDCYNNVAHVGHCHPRVVAAIASQARTLNTNTRYLNRLIGEYAERLTATFPRELDTVFFTNSGSEATELALRIARTLTGRHQVAVLDWAYHGNTQAAIDASPYKYKRAGGKGRPDFVIELPCPDPYRSPGDWPAEAIGFRYAEHLELALLSGASPAAFIAETIPSCAGQVVLPQGFLPRTFELIRAAGGLCISDEVQVGFGRVGTHMWAFEEHGVVPDIVTLGKPMGNGHPVGAVVTTRSIARRFANGMEYFNTFGGNPVSCAAGLAVLDVLESQQLRANARARGASLTERIAALQAGHPLIGDVRGRGLFLGIELVRDRTTKEPATEAAAVVVNQCRKEGVLLGTDGPYDNVIKLRPPMTFQASHEALLLESLGRSLEAAAKT
ncbi:MAG: aminotransferase class III-fold pyridoxal phosphate-dependent enzyme [Gemmatimonadetes bacterium]|nr:aminotransferase class III-fold pyridoxal phosphate-dependent enzyme [Gemmatimonadota bacterium]